MGVAFFVGTYIHEVQSRVRGVVVMDKTAFFTMPSGLYVVTAAADGMRAGCVINTAVQVTSMPPRISVAVNKDNVTSGVIASAKAFALTVIDQATDMLYIGNFGFRTSSDYDKFAKYETFLGENDANLVNAINFIDQTKTNEQTVEEKVAPELTDQDRKTRSQRKLIKALLWGGAMAMAAITAYVIYGACMLLM